MRVGRARATGDTSPSVRVSEIYLPPEAPESLRKSQREAPMLSQQGRERSKSTVADHTFDLCIVSPIPESFKKLHDKFTQEECLRALVPDEDEHAGAAEWAAGWEASWEEHWAAHFAEHGEPIERGKVLISARTGEEYTPAEAQVYAGVWIERRARAGDARALHAVARP